MRMFVYVGSSVCVHDIPITIKDIQILFVAKSSKENEI